jgi:hypothetical protein
VLARDLAGQSDAYRILDDEAGGAPTGILVLPYLAGGGTPYMDGATPATIAGFGWAPPGASCSARSWRVNPTK